MHRFMNTSLKCKTKSLFVDHALLIHPESEEKMKVELKTLDNNTLVSMIPFKETQNNGELLEDFKMRIKSGINWVYAKLQFHNFLRENIRFSF